MSLFINFGYCFRCSINIEKKSFSALFGLIFISFAMATIIICLSRGRKFFIWNCAKLLQKQLLANKAKIDYLNFYYALTANLQFNFKPLFDFIEIFKKYLRQFIIQNNVVGPSL